MNLLKDRQRPLKICVVNQEPRLVDRHLAAIESELKKIYEVELEKISSVDNIADQPCDLLIVIAHQLEAEELVTWVKALGKRIEKNNAVSIPSLIIGQDLEVPSKDLMSFAISENWYFDLISAEHLGSLAIRAANLIRIHDHIHELGRYESTIKNLENQVKELEEKLS